MSKPDIFSLSTSSLSHLIDEGYDFGATRGGHTTFSQVMLRTSNPDASIAWYRKHLNMQLVSVSEFSSFNLYFLATPTPTDPPVPDVADREAARAWLKAYRGVVLELTWNKSGKEAEPGFKYHNGNASGTPGYNACGFGHIGFLVDSLPATEFAMLADGTEFVKRQMGGSMKTLAFALDPDGYRVELIQKSSKWSGWPGATLQQAMLRVADPALSLPFYKEAFGVVPVAAIHFSSFSLYFLGPDLSDRVSMPDPTSPEAFELVNAWPRTLVELTHNHGTEGKPSEYVSGNAEPYRGFGHLGWNHKSMADAVARMDTSMTGVQWQKRPEQGTMRSIAFVKDPDGYWQELISR